MFIIIVFDEVLTRSSPVSSQVSSLPRDQSLLDLISSLGSSCYSRKILNFAFMNLLSCYYYYGYVVIGVLSPLWLN